MQQRDRFLETWQAGQGARGHSGYRPVVRTVEPEEGSWDEAAGRVEEEPGPDGMARGEARGVERPSWVALLGRPWSWRWRWVLGIGAAACVAVWAVTVALLGLTVWRLRQAETASDAAQREWRQLKAQRQPEVSTASRFLFWFQEHSLGDEGFFLNIAPQNEEPSHE